MIDAEGVRLPDSFHANELGRVSLAVDKTLQLRIITGAGQPKPEAGRPWPGEDVRAGLELVKLLHGKPFAADVAIVDVSNFGGRIDANAAHLVLHTRFDTEIRWGRPIRADDFYVEIDPARKLELLEKIHTRYGRVDAGWPWIDVRFERPSRPADLLGDRRDGERRAPADRHASLGVD
jgi:hypothetical protein